MTAGRLVIGALLYYRRTNAAVVLGVATAVAVLGGALLVGDSVRGSLRDLVLNRLGHTDQAIVSSGFFREALAGDIAADEAFATSFDSVAPLIIVEAVVGDQATGRRVSRVPVYGVDERFWRFHGIARPGWEPGSDRREALISVALADEIGSTAGGAVLLHMARPSAVPIESLHGRKDDLGRTLRLNVQAIVGPAELGEFSLRPQQGRVRAVFVPLRRLQLELDRAERVNTLLLSTPRSIASTGRPSEPALQPTLEAIVRRRATLDDLGLTLRTIETPRTIVLESAAGLIDAAQGGAAERAARDTGAAPHSIFTYLANTLRGNNREVPYSLVTAIDRDAVPGMAPSNDPRPPIVINEWTARDLGAHAGDPLTLEYVVWEEPGRLITRTADFHIAAIVPIQGIAADRTLAPVYPGISDSDTLADWDPPFPFDLRRVRKIDEDYWKQYRTTPKAFVPLDVGQRLWRSRYGDRTSVRVTPAEGGSLVEARDSYAARMRTALVVGATGLIGRGLTARLRAAGCGVIGASRSMGAEGDLVWDLARPPVAWPRNVNVDVTYVCAGPSGLAECEADPDGTRRINVDGVVAVARLAAQAGSRVVMVSTSHVFDGTSAMARPADPRHPITAYGAQKAEAEQAVLSLPSAVLRLSRVVGPHDARPTAWRDGPLAGAPSSPSTTCSWRRSLDDVVTALRRHRNDRRRACSSSPTACETYHSRAGAGGVAGADRAGATRPRRGCNIRRVPAPAGSV